MSIETWVYVTGAPRSGTTFVGRILSSPLTVDYIHEPFNPDCGMPGIDRRYLYLRAGLPAPEPYGEAIRSLFSYRLRLRTGLYPEDSSWKRLVKRVVGSRGPFHLRLAKLNPFHRAAVVKDPIGALLTAHLADRYPIRPVVLVRHPLAFVASMRRLGWLADLEALRSQKELVEDYFAAEASRLSPQSDDPIVGAGTLWWALNRVLLSEASRRPDWIVVTHEEISARPVPEFERLYAELGLPWSDAVARRIRRTTGGKNPAEARNGKTQDFSRDSQNLFSYRAGSLSREERRTVFQLTSDVALRVYDTDSFGLDGEPQLGER